MFLAEHSLVKCSLEGIGSTRAYMGCNLGIADSEGKVALLLIVIVEYNLIWFQPLLDTIIISSALIYKGGKTKVALCKCSTNFITFDNHNARNSVSLHTQTYSTTCSVKYWVFNLLQVTCIFTVFKQS